LLPTTIQKQLKKTWFERIYSMEFKKEKSFGFSQAIEMKLLLGGRPWSAGQRNVKLSLPGWIE